jgi:hypothetical protein
MMKGSTYKRCGCTDTEGKPLGTNCPRLRGKSHGTWYLYAELPNGPGGARRRKRQGGFATQRDAQTALFDLLDRVQKRTPVDAGRQTLSTYLDDWLAGKARLRASTRRTYAEHIRLYLKPALGHLRLDQLAVVDIERMYAAIRQLGNPHGKAAGPELQALLAARERSPLPKPLTDARLRRIHTTLMSALNTAVKRRLLPFNPAAHVELAAGRRPRRRSGPSNGSRSGEPPANGRRWRCGCPARLGRSSTTPSTTGSTPCSTLSPSVACAAARPSGCAGPRWISNTTL